MLIKKESNAQCSVGDNDIKSIVNSARVFFEGEHDE